MPADEIPEHFELFVAQSNIGPEIKQQLKELLAKYDDRMAKEWADCGLIPGVTLKLDLIPGAQPFKKAPYKTNAEMEDEITRQTGLMNDADFIIPSNSEYASPITMQRKHKININGEIITEWRMCIDYRLLNSITVKDHYPLPNIHELYRHFAGKKWFSALDLRHGYHHIAIRPEDRHKTAFIAHNGLFEFKRMTFGFVNAPAAFQRAMDYIFRHLDFVIVYIDDILILSKTKEEHIKHLQAVFDVLDKYNMMIRREKCQFFKTELKYLGFILSGDGMRPDPEYVQKIIDLEKPNGKPALLRVLGMINWLHRYIPRLSDYLFPLTEMTKKNVPFNWDDNCAAAFAQIKKLVSNTQLLRHPDMHKQFYVVCDASEIGIGAVLMQKYGDVLEPVEFWSHKFNVTQQNWYTGEKELMAIVLTLEKFTKYLLGNKFIVFTDHKNLEYVQKKYDTNNLFNKKFNRWLVRIEQFDFDCYYIKGIINYVPDYLSRLVQRENVSHTAYKTNPNFKLDHGPLMKPINNKLIR
ncbi:MAG: hypothetical protein GY938_29185, partial [Ketobacter sp.]|nr:hypothetical protein [Ketobacter sp.]